MSAIIALSEIGNRITVYLEQVTEAAGSARSVFLVCAALGAFLFLTSLPGGRGEQEEWQEETMQTLEERFTNYVRRHGIEIEPESVRSILAEYAGLRELRLKPSVETKPVILEWLCTLLLQFFPEENGNLPDKKIGLIRQDYGGTDGTVIIGRQCAPISLQSDENISFQAFQSILRETEEQFYLPESAWKRVDAFRERCAAYKPDIGNFDIRCAERMSSVMLSLGASEEEALRAVMDRIFVPCVLRTGQNINLSEREKISAYAAETVSANQRREYKR